MRETTFLESFLWLWAEWAETFLTVKLSLFLDSVSLTESCAGSTTVSLVWAVVHLLHLHEECMTNFSHSISLPSFFSVKKWRRVILRVSPSSVSVILIVLCLLQVLSWVSLWLLRVSLLCFEGSFIIIERRRRIKRHIQPLHHHHWLHPKHHSLHSHLSMSWSNTISSRGPVEVTPSQTSSGSIKGMNCITTTSMSMQKREERREGKMTTTKKTEFQVSLSLPCFFSQRYYCATTSFSTESAVTVSLCVFASSDFCSSLTSLLHLSSSRFFFFTVFLERLSAWFSFFFSSLLHHHRLSIPLLAISLSKSVMMSSWCLMWEGV